MIRRRPTELPESLENSAPQGSQLSSLMNQYHQPLDPVEQISLFRQLGEESEKPEYSEQIDAQSPSNETLPSGVDEQINAQGPSDETLPSGVDDQIDAQSPSDETLPPGEDDQVNTQGPSETV
eukprot:2421566-Pleurochrysis_carterae.AAC.2